MDKNTSLEQANLIQEIVAYAKNEVSKTQKDLVQLFIENFYTNPDVDSLSRLPVAELGNALVSLFNFFYDRKEGEPKIRVFQWKPEKKLALAERIIIEIVNENRSFAVDSLTVLLEKLETKARLNFHPIYRVERDAQGVLVNLSAPTSDEKNGHLESVIHCEIVENAGPQLVAQLIAELPKVLADVKAANEDWMPMRQKALDTVQEIQSWRKHTKLNGELDEVVEFLEWIEADHFTFLGYCYYDFEFNSPDRIVKESKHPEALGILKTHQVGRLQSLFEGINLGASTREFIFEEAPLLIIKTTKISTVHRGVPMDCIGLRRFDEKGKVVGIHLFVGLFTSVAYDSSARDIPLLRKKVLKIIDKAGFRVDWHDGKALTHILDSLPRDELFQASVDDLATIGLAILRLQERQRVALFVRRDLFDRFLSCLVYIPRDRFDSELCDRIGDLLEREFDGTVGAYKAQFGALSFARVHYILTSAKPFKKQYDLHKIEQVLIEASRSWVDDLKKTISDNLPELEGNDLYVKYRRAFNRGYQERFSGNDVLQDILEVEKAQKSGTLRLRSYGVSAEDGKKFKIKIYQPNQPLALSDVLPILENLDLKVVSEIPFKVQAEGQQASLWIHDFELVSNSIVDIQQNASEFAYTFGRVFSGDVENDDFNRLVLRAGLNCRQCEILRAYSRYLRQIKIPYSHSYIASILAKNADVISLIIELFEKRFNPEIAQHDDELYQKINEALEGIAQADEDRILRAYLNLVTSTLRTNAYQKNGSGKYKETLSFKFDSRSIEEMPLPKPMFEIFVYSSRLEAVHLRGGKVARGGIRWSDRPEDFRTEILGLMKAQMVKNTVIVPVGSKGGFVLKRQLEGLSRDEIQKEGITCYKLMMQGLLDITDNLVHNKPQRPLDTVCWDDVDPYLVVAADKGTATFSDIANEIAQANNFWLGDAFASGGSVGYDHKKMGITARGAWESVKRHFRELGKNIQQESFTVVGVGDMAGDVFGNGMLQSKHTKLVAAFNHAHIFIDPNPDAQTSYNERKRMFELPRSSWEDYDKSLISKGGGVFSRNEKVISLSREIQDLLGVTISTMKPAELIRRLLTLEVDLLWFGGIGTFVKSTQEGQTEVGDRANEALRVNAKELNCRVIGEGANLGVTQLGRIEFERKANGHINTDFIDNSAGVASSDREVNIKILLNEIVQSKKLTLPERNKILAKMTDDVGLLVLRDNYFQPQTISFISSMGARKIERQAKLIRFLEAEGILNRQIENLPEDSVLEEYQHSGIGLSRAEIAVIFSYSKIYYYEKILKTKLPDDRYFEKDLVQYFPKLLQDKYKEEILEHPLRREIIATHIVNQVVNRMGASFIQEAMDITGAPMTTVLQAFFLVTSIFDLNNVWREIEALDNKVPDAVQQKTLRDVFKILKRTIFWILKYYPQTESINETINTLSIGIDSFLKNITNTLDARARAMLAEDIASYRQDKLSIDLAERLSMLRMTSTSPDIILVASQTGFTVPEVAKLYFLVGTRFGFYRLRDVLDQTGVANSVWERQLITTLQEDLYIYQSELVTQLLNYARTLGLDLVSGHEGVIEQWITAHKNQLDKLEFLFNESKLETNPQISVISLISRELRTLSGQ